MSGKPIDLSGQKFNKLTVLSFSHVSHESYWLCKCDCGNEKVIKSSHLKSGHTKSCGCIRKTGVHYLYATWSGMKDRCYNEKSPNYKNYGGRGVFVCDRWKDSFKNFIDDMGDRPKGLTLDREDNYGGYTPENCRWATAGEQANNRRNLTNTSSRKYTAFGQSRTISDWSKETGLSYCCIKNRLLRGWTVEDAVTRNITE